MSDLYCLAPVLSNEVARELDHLDPLMAQLLFNRAIVTKKDATRFISPDYERDRHDPFQLPNMDVAVKRLLRAISQNERVVIYADYDCDGIPGAVVLHDFFKAVGFHNFEQYIPHRHYEGFGFSTYAVEKIAKKSVDLIVTVDCGTADTAAIEIATTCGIDVIVTDHHLPPPTGVSTNAIAIVNPKLDDSYPFKELCGTGVVFKLVEALIARGEFELIPGKEKWWLDMVGLATVGDLVPLVGENRVLARYGLEVLRKSRRPGLQHLMRKTRMSQRHLTEDDIGFTIAPRINAASRMDTPDDAFFMLVAEDESDAGARVAHLERLNNERKGIVAAMTKELKKRISEMIELPDVLVMGNVEWRPALAGLAANSLADTYKRPAFVWGRDGNGVIKGSCRSEGVTSVAALMESARDIFIEYGGHHMSGGFSVSDEHMFTFGNELNAAYRANKTQTTIDEPKIVDATLTLADVNVNLFSLLAQLAPYGVGNPKPLFEFKGVTPQRVETFGKSGEHIKLVFEDGGRRIEAIAFFASLHSFHTTPAVGTPLTLLGHAEQSFFMNRMQTRIRIVDLV